VPRTRRIVRGKLAAQTVSNGLIASARNLTMRSGAPTKPKKIKASEWHPRAWVAYDLIEVYHYGVQWVGNTMSRAELYVAEDGKKTTNEDAIDCLNRFYGGPNQHGEFLRQAGIHMTVAGDGYIFGEGAMSRDPEGDDVDWMVIAALKVKNTASGGYKIEGEEVDETHSLVIRFWRPHPISPDEPDSPTRPLLPVLFQLNRLTQYTDAQLSARITNNGIMLFPSSMAFPKPVETPEGQTAEQAGLMAWMQEFAKTMGAAIEDPSSAAARVPSALMGEAEDLKEVRLLELWSALDEHAPDMREEAIRRVALGLDMPPEALLGMSEANHWGAWQIDDSLIKSHAEPLLDLLTQALTTDYLRIMLEEQYGWDYEDTLRFTIEADTSAMRLRPNRSREAIELWDRGELNGAALRRETGFDETDGMDEKEKTQWLLYKLAGGSPSPGLVARAARELGIDVDGLEEVEAVEGDDGARGERPLPRSLEKHPKEDPPERPAAALLAVAEAATFHALGRAGNRMKSSGAKITGIPEGVPAVERYQYAQLNRDQLNFVLTDAWSLLDHLTLPDGVDRGKFETALDNYARMLITQREPFDRVVLGRYLTMALRGEAA